MGRTFDNNVAILSGIFNDQEFSGRGLANTSRLDASGSPESDPSAGLSAGYIWVRRQGGRSSSRAVIGAGLRGWERIPNLLVEVGLNRNGELVAIKPADNTEAVISYGNALATAPAQSQYIQAQQFTPGLVTADKENDYGLSVYVQPLTYRDQVIKGTVDVSASVPSSTGERRLAVITWDVSAEDFVVINGTATTSLAPFTIEDAVAIALAGTDRIRLGAVELSNGQTSIGVNNHFIDCRDWLTLHEATATVAAEDVTYDNGTSGLTATDVQAAIDELEGLIGTGGSPYTPPPTSSWTWDNQGSASVSFASDTMFMRTPGVASGTQLRIQYRTAPSAPYVITVALHPTFNLRDAAAVATIGLLFRESSSGKLAVFDYEFLTTGMSMQSRKYTNSTTFSADYLSISTPSLASSPVWLRISDDNTNRICEWSSDGVNFESFHSVGRTDFLTADQIGVFLASGAHSGSSAAVTVVSWAVT